MTKEDYKHRISGDEWKEFANKCKEFVDHTCQMCGLITNKSKLNLHHMSYSLIKDRRESENIIVICEDCHHTFHENSKAASKSLDRDYLTLHLAKTLMRSGRDISFFFENGDMLSRRWKYIPHKIIDQNERIKLAEAWEPKKVDRTHPILDRLFNGEIIHNEEILKGLNIPSNPTPHKWKKKLFKHFNLIKTRI